MRYMRLSAQTRAAIRSAAIGNNFDESRARKNDDGSYDVPLDDEVIARVQQLRMKGETFDDAVLRMVTFMQAGGKRN